MPRDFLHVRSILRLTEVEVARRAISTRERVRKLVELGILAPEPDSDQPFRPGEALRIQLVQHGDAVSSRPENPVTVQL